MCSQNYNIFLFIIAGVYTAVFSQECINMVNPQTRTFAGLVKFQGNDMSFNPGDKSFQGNVVAFSASSIEIIPKNSFLALDSTYIVKLILKDKNIRQLEDGAFLLLNCTENLELQNNKIVNISRGTFEGLPTLQVLDLSDNSIQEIPEQTFFYTSRLIHLNMTGNKIKYLHPESFFNLGHLLDLILSFNELAKMPWETMQYFANLTNLQLNSNKLSEIEPHKWNIPKLTILELSNNKLDSFDPGYTFAFGPSLQELRLGNNNLIKLNAFALRNNFQRLHVLDLTGNPWYCGDLITITHALKDSSITYGGNTKTGPNEDGIACSDDNSTSIHKTTSADSEDDIVGVFTSGPSTEDASKKKDVYNDEVIQSLQKWQSSLVVMFVIILVAIVVDVLARTGILGTIFNYRRRLVLDNRNVENFALLT